MSVRWMVWAAVGMLAGVGQAAALWQAAHRPRGTQVSVRGLQWSHVMRLPVVAGVLIASAVAGGLLPATAGWAVALLAAGAFYLGTER